jgi:hypothetical protein
MQPLIDTLVNDFSKTEFDTVNVKAFKVESQEQLERMFGDGMWSKVEVLTSSNQTYNEEDLQRFIKEAKVEAEAEVAVIASVSEQKAKALKKMERQMEELRAVNTNARKTMKWSIKESEDRLVAMEKQYVQPLELMDPANAHILTVNSPIGFESEMTSENIENAKKLLQQAYEFFDGVNVDDSGNFSLRDALSNAYMMEYPEKTYEDIKKHADVAIRNCQRQLSKKRKLEHEATSTLGSKKKTENDTPGFQF